MILDINKSKLFDQAYNAYLSITKYYESMFSDGMVDPFSDAPSVTDIVCSLDLYLQGALFQIGFADGSLTDEELFFIKSLPDEYDEVCARNRGYKRFVNTISKETFAANAKKYYFVEDKPLFLQIINDATDDAALIKGNLEVVFNAFIAIDDVVSESENTVALRLLNEVYTGEGKTTLEDEESPYQKQEVDTGVKAITDTKADMPTGDLDEAIQELENLVGLDSVKQEVLAAINLLKINKMRVEKGLPELQISRHMVFTGNPGTGKTTVARIMAKIFKSLGVVSKGHLIETDRSGMVAGYVGQTALKTAQVIKKAKGGVLFIDEAYALSSADDNSNDYGKEAIDTLVKGMEDFREDLVVIVAGYTDEMQRFIAMNPGLRSRFNKYIHFDDYSADEMLSIFKIQCKKAKFILDPEAEATVLAYFKGRQGDPQFGNARGVRNFFDSVVTRQATRIISMPGVSDRDFQTICVEDIGV